MRVHASLHLGPGDHPTAHQSDTRLPSGLPNVWVVLDTHREGIVFPSSADQCDELAAAFTEAARLIRQGQE